LIHIFVGTEFTLTQTFGSVLLLSLALIPAFSALAPFDRFERLTAQGRLGVCVRWRRSFPSSRPSLPLGRLGVCDRGRRGLLGPPSPFSISFGVTKEGKKYVLAPAFFEGRRGKFVVCVAQQQEAPPRLWRDATL